MEDKRAAAAEEVCGEVPVVKASPESGLARPCGSPCAGNRSSDNPSLSRRHSLSLYCPSIACSWFSHSHYKVSRCLISCSDCDLHCDFLQNDTNRVPVSKMSFITRRGLSTLIPPKVRTPRICRGWVERNSLIETNSGY